MHFLPAKRIQNKQMSKDKKKTWLDDDIFIEKLYWNVEKGKQVPSVQSNLFSSAAFSAFSYNLGKLHQAMFITIKFANDQNTK